MKLGSCVSTDDIDSTHFPGGCLSHAAATGNAKHLWKISTGGVLSRFFRPLQRDLQGSSGCGAVEEWREIKWKNGWWQDYAWKNQGLKQQAICKRCDWIAVCRLSFLALWALWQSFSGQDADLHALIWSSVWSWNVVLEGSRFFFGANLLSPFIPWSFGVLYCPGHDFLWHWQYFTLQAALQACLSRVECIKMIELEKERPSKLEPCWKSLVRK